MAKEADRERIAPRSEWFRKRIEDYCNLSPSEQESLQKHLKGIVPKREFGEGLEKYTDFIRPSDAQTYEDYEAAMLLQFMGQDSLWGRNHPRSAPLQDIIALAKHVLRENGFENIYEDYLYWSPQFKKWRNLRRGVGHEIEKRQDEFLLHGSPDINKYLEWEEKYPWRNPFTVVRLVIESSEPNSQIWCAVKILWMNEILEESLRELLHPSSKMPATQRRSSVLGLVRYAVEIGTLGEFLRWKRDYEGEVISSFAHKVQLREKAQKGAERRQVKADLARQKLEELAFAPDKLRHWVTKRDKQQVSFLISLASNFNQTNDERLFQQNYKLLSRSWFESRLSEWRATGKLDQAVEKLPSRQ